MAKPWFRFLPKASRGWSRDQVTVRHRPWFLRRESHGEAVAFGLWSISYLCLIGVIAKLLLASCVFLFSCFLVCYFGIDFVACVILKQSPAFPSPALVWGHRRPLWEALQQTTVRCLYRHGSSEQLKKPPLKKCWAIDLYIHRRSSAGLGLQQHHKVIDGELLRIPTF